MKYATHWIGTVLLWLTALTGTAQPIVQPYRAGMPLTEFRDACYYLSDSTFWQGNSPPVNADFIHSHDLDFDQLGAQYWMRFTIENQESTPVEIQIFVGLSEILDFYVPQGDGHQRHVIGTFERRDQVSDITGPGKTFLAQAVVELAPGQRTTYYARFHHLSSGAQAQRDAELAPRIMDADVWYEKVTTSNYVWSVIFGCFIILILYHLVYYVFTREEAYLYYCLFVFSVGFPFLTLIRDLVTLPGYNALLFFSVSGLFAVFYFQFTRKLLRLQTLLPRWDKRLWRYALIKTGLIVAYCIIYFFTTNIFVILAVYIPAILVELVLMIWLAVALIKTRDKISLSYVIGSSLAWLGMFLTILNSDPATSFTPQITPFKFSTPAYGFLLESLFLGMVLAYRSRLNEVEKNEAQSALIQQLKANKALQEKVNEELEAKVVERTKTIEEEREKSENLLLNVLPAAVVKEMKETGGSAPRRFDNVSVLYCDFEGFTRIAEGLSPEHLVERLDYFFKHFDTICERNQLEKIKTIGDAYMAVSGIPDFDEHHAVHAVQAALEFQGFLKEFNGRLAQHEDHWHLRIGIQTGPVVAGVIGDYKFTYDVWGDTVNTASRLETNSEGGRINISADVFELVKHQYQCTPRGSIDVKNKGMMEMYYVEGTAS